MAREVWVKENAAGALLWPSDDVREAGDYEAAVAHSGELALRFVSLADPPAPPAPTEAKLLGPAEALRRELVAALRKAKEANLEYGDEALAGWLTS